MPFREPASDGIGREHRKFWECIKAGGKVWRDDRLNGVQEWLDLARLGGDANEVQRYGFNDLHLIAAPHIPEWLEPLLSQNDRDIMTHPMAVFLQEDPDGNRLPGHQQLIESPVGSMYIDSIQKAITGYGPPVPRPVRGRTEHAETQVRARTQGMMGP